MVLIDIPDNPNCAGTERVFHELEGPRAVAQVRVERSAGGARWYEVTGWSPDSRPVPAWIQKVDDSGDGVAFLLHGGQSGVRLRPAASPRPWHLEDPEQWGTAVMLFADPEDVRPAAGAPLVCGSPEATHG